MCRAVGISVRNLVRQRWSFSPARRNSIHRYCDASRSKLIVVETRDPTSAVPPQASQNGSSGVGGHIPWVAGGMRYEFWADPLKQHRPKDEVACDFRELWGLVVRANTEPPVQPKNGRQRAWDEPEIVEIRMEKPCTYMRLDHPAVDGIRGASHEAE